MNSLFSWPHALLGGILLFASAAHADRYFTWVDAQGQVRTTIVREEENPLEDQAGQVREKQASGPESVAADTLDSVAGPSSTPSHSVFNLRNFPDANALAERGYIREGEAGPFYTWTDATGAVHNTPFNPAREIQVAKEQEAGSGPLAPGEGGEYSQAVTVRRDAGLPHAAAPFAAAVLGLKGGESTLIEAFSRTCCNTIEKENVHALDPERGTSLRIEADAPVFDFATGPSPYRIVELPDHQGTFPLRLRSFVTGGVFLPTLVFLNERWQPVRLVTDIDFNYEPESWYRYGYLEALLPVEPRKNEHWMLVLSKGSDLNNHTIYKKTEDQNTAVLRPSRLGELELVLGSTVNQVP